MNTENDIFQQFNQILAKKSKISVNSTEEMEIEGRIPSKPFIFWIGNHKYWILMWKHPKETQI